MRKIFIMIILALSFGQLMSYDVLEINNEENLLDVKAEKEKNFENSIKYKFVDKSEAGTKLRAMLNNGLEVIIHKLPNTEVVAVRAYAKIGGIYEGENLGSGISHYCEHLVSGGTTKKRTEKENSELLRSIGGNNNAYTTFNHTCYYVTTLNKYAETAIDLLGDWLSGCVIKESEFNREKGVIITEVDKGETEPSRIFNKFVMSKLFGNTPMSVPVIGYPSLVKKVTREKMMAFYNKFYCPNNTVLSIAGGVDPQETLEQIVKYWGSWQRKPLEMPSISEVKGQTIGKEFCLSSEILKGESAQLRISYHTVPMQNKDMFALDVLSEILTGSENSTLVKLLKNEKHLVNSIDSYSWTPGFGFGQFTISANTKYENLKDVRDSIFDELTELQNMKTQKNEIIRAKKRIRGDYINYLQGADAHAKTNATNLIFNLGLDYDEKYLEEIDKVTAEEIMYVAKKYLENRQSNVFAFYSKDAENKDEDKNPFKKPEKSEKDELGKSKISEMITLENGMKIILKRTPGTKSVAVAGFTHGGLRFENADNCGIFRVLSMLMKRGSEKYSFEKIAEIFSDLGGKLSLSSGNNTLSVEAKFVSGEDHIEKVFSVINDVLRNPKFDEKELEQIKKLLNYSIQRKDESWEDEAIWLLRKKFFANHPYSMYINGTEESLKKITLEQIKKLHSQYVSPNNFVFAIVGDYDLSKAARVIRGIFSSWKKSNEKLGEFTGFEKRNTKEVVCKTSSKKQTTICIGYNGSKLSNREDVLRLTLLDAIISGIYMPSGWLHEALRGGDRKYVYYVHAMKFFGQDAGMFYVLTQCSAEDKDKVLEIIREQMKRTWTEKINEKELELAKRIYKTNTAIFNESNEDKAVEYALDELYGIGWDNMQTDFDIVDKITVEDLKAVAEKYLKDNELLVLIEPEK